MKTITGLQTFEQIKCLADLRRLEILRRLMAEAATLTRLGVALGKSPAWVQHHVRALQSAGLAEIAEVRTHGKVTEKYYRAVAAGFLLQEMILPEDPRPVLLLSGSHDLAR